MIWDGIDFEASLQKHCLQNKNCRMPRHHLGAVQDAVFFQFNVTWRKPLTAVTETWPCCQVLHCQSFFSFKPLFIMHALCFLHCIDPFGHVKYMHHVLYMYIYNYIYMCVWNQSENPSCICCLCQALPLELREMPVLGVPEAPRVFSIIFQGYFPLCLVRSVWTSWNTETSGRS